MFISFQIAPFYVNKSVVSKQCISKKWMLDVNNYKRKVMIFHKRKLEPKTPFKFNTKILNWWLVSSISELFLEQRSVETS